MAPLERPQQPEARAVSCRPVDIRDAPVLPDTDIAEVATLSQYDTNSSGVKLDRHDMTYTQHEPMPSKVEMQQQILVLGQSFGKLVKALIEDIPRLDLRIKSLEDRSGPNIADVQSDTCLQRGDQVVATAKIRLRSENEVAYDAERRDSEAENDEVNAPKPCSSHSETSAWQPLAVRQMPKTQQLENAKANAFEEDFLRRALKGKQWSHGYYACCRDTNSNLPECYWTLDAHYEPFLPLSPGLHGAKLSPFFNNDESPSMSDTAHLNTPVFVRSKEGDGFVYFGHYSQNRYSDKLDYDSLFDRVPEHVRRYWAEQLASKNRPQWSTNELIKQLWPQPTFDGPILALESTGAASADVDFRHALELYAQDLLDWKSDVEKRASALTPDDLLGAFAKADCDTEPGLRLYWEYLEFQHYDTGFVDMLTASQTHETGGRATDGAVAHTIGNRFTTNGQKRNDDNLGPKEKINAGAAGFVPPHLRKK